MDHVFSLIGFSGLPFVLSSPFRDQGGSMKILHSDRGEILDLPLKVAQKWFTAVIKMVTVRTFRSYLVVLHSSH